MNPKDFEAASKAAEGWPVFVLNAARLGAGDQVDAAYELLMPGDGRNKGTLLASFNEHAEVITEIIPRLRAVSDGSWTPGSDWGRRSIGRVKSSILPHVWSSGHEAAHGIAITAIQLLVRPLETQKKGLAQFRRRLMKQFAKALTLTVEQLADLQERIRRERAKVLEKKTTTPDAPADEKNYREEGNPRGRLLTVEYVKERYLISGTKLTIAFQNKEVSRIKNPEGRGYAYGWAYVRRESNRKSG